MLTKDAQTGIKTRKRNKPDLMKMPISPNNGLPHYENSKENIMQHVQTTPSRRLTFNEQVRRMRAETKATEQRNVQDDKPFPAELRARDQWVVRDIGGGSNPKMPLNPHTGGGASPNDPSTWGSYEIASNTEGFDGIGFVFSSDDPYIGIDIDKCCDPVTGETEEWALNIIRDLNSYTEISPSRKGVHIFIKGNKKGDKCRARKLPAEWHAAEEAGIEIYDKNRFFTMTGNRIEEASFEIKECQHELEALYNEIWPKKVEKQEPTGSGEGSSTECSTFEQGGAGGRKLDLDKLENIQRKNDGKITARCPACGEEGRDRSGDHLFIAPDGRFGCVMHKGETGHEHRCQIYKLVGTNGKYSVNEIDPAPAKENKIHDTLEDAIGAMAWSLEQNAACAYEPKHTAEYRQSDSTVFGYVVRFEDPTGENKKEPRPFHMVGDGVRAGDPEGEKWPLYRGERLVPGGPVHVFEGEPNVDDAESIGMTNCTTSAHGSDSVAKTDWGLLEDREIVIFPDNNQAGEKYARQVVVHAKPSSAKFVRLEAVPDGGDISDWLEERDSIDPAELKAELDSMIEQAESANIEDLIEEEKPSEESETPEQHETRKTPETLETLTDTGNAKRFVGLHGRDLLFTDQTGWYVWNARYWEPDTKNQALLKTTDVADILRQHAFSIKIDAHSPNGDKQRQESLIKFANKSLDGRRRREILALAKAEPGMTVSINDFDYNPWLVNCQNGTLDLSTMELKPHRREDMITHILPVQYDRNAKCPRWKQFMREVFQDDNEIVEFMQRAIGYSLTGDISEQCVFILYGYGKNGKSTMLNTIREVIEPLVRHASIETFTERRKGSIPEDRARLRDVRFVTASEPDKSHKLDENFIKDATGGEPITARFMRQNSFEFSPKFKVFLACNHRPKITGTDEGIWRRIRLIPFEKQFDKNDDPALEETLAGEHEGILAWAVEGCRKWREQGLEMPAPVKAATECYRTESDLLGIFIEERCNVADELTTTAKDLYEAYRQWAEEGGYKAKSQRNFGFGLKEKGFEHATRSSSGMRWGGIAIKNE